jgi:hypothetical protein
VLPISDFFALVSVVIWTLQLVWVGRIWNLGFARHYPILLTYLVLSTVLGVGMFILGRIYEMASQSPDGVVYYWAWVATRPLYWTLLFCVLVEVHNRTLERFHGFQRLGQLFISVSLGLVGSLFLVMTLLGPVRASIRRFLDSQQLSIFLALTLFSALLVLFAAYFRLDVPGNLRLIYGVVAISVASATIFRALGDMSLLGQVTSVGSTRINSLVYLGCLTVAVLRFSAAGEEQREVLDIPLGGAAVGRDVTQGLEGLNQQLARILRS